MNHVGKYNRDISKKWGVYMSQLRQYVDNKIFKPGEIIRAYYHDAVLEEYTPIHTHNFHELNIVIAGNGKHYINDSVMHITIGDLFIMPPNVSHGYEFDSKNFSIFHLLFHKDFFKKYESHLNNLTGYHILFNIDPKIQRQNSAVNNFLHIDISENYNLIRIFNELTVLEEEQNCNTKTEKEFLAVYVIAKICEMLEHGNDSNKKGHYPYDMLKSVEYIHLNYGEHIDLQTLHTISCMSASSYLRYFKKIFNCTPTDYIQDYRLRQAKSMLKYTDHSLTTIANDCGFWDNAHFSKLFKKKYDLSPLKYRAMLKSEGK